MKKVLNKDSILVGVVCVLVSELLCAGVVALVVAVMGLPMADYARWFAVCLVPPLLLLRYYAKRGDCPDTLKAVITTLFVTTIVIFGYMIKHHLVSFH